MNIFSSDGEKRGKLLDKVAGIGLRDGQMLGLNEEARKDLRCLPMIVVRRVE